MNKRTNKTTLQTTSFIDINEKTPVFEEGMHPLELYVQGTLDQRINILLNHPAVQGFIFISDETITKAFFLKRVTDWKTNKSVIAAVTGSPDVFMPFSISEEMLGSDNLFLAEPPQLHKLVETISAHKFIKENKKTSTEAPSVCQYRTKTETMPLHRFPRHPPSRYRTPL